MSISADAWAAALARGETPESFGIVLTTLWQTTPPELKEQYESFRKEVAEAAGEDCLYIYPYHALHCTVASLCKFTCKFGSDLAKDKSRQGEVVKAWQTAVDNAFSSPKMIRKPINVTVNKPQLPGTVGIIMIDNPDKEVFAIRDLLREACKDPVLQKYNVRTEIPETTHFPNIVHSSFARFIRAPKDEKKLRAAFASVAEKWKPIQAQIKQIHLTTETTPYMHMEKKSNVAKTYVLSELKEGNNSKELE
mmetsp:Transcript_24480/g.45795  ORF Transcript_24480/g.45795 Transcript_24480/m.45795 type:complete len:250 (-) Transcript_24480:78-827(-)